MEQRAKQVKPFLEYDQLVERLRSRGMILRDPLRAQRKLTQIGYYRLSGYWYPSQQFEINPQGKIVRFDEFQAGTTFESIFEFYLFDKKIRLELLCAIERIEIYVRTVVAHELGRLDPQAHTLKRNFSRFATGVAEHGNSSEFERWQHKHQQLLNDSREESIVSHLSDSKPIPIWVACEAWNFGTLSKLYSMLNGANQQIICDRLGIDKRQVLDNWLINLNGVRNRCAHHSRVCNRSNIRTLMFPRTGFFNLIALDSLAHNKLYGLITVICFLLDQIGPGSDWIRRMADLVDSKPKTLGLTFKSMGMPATGFPRQLFPKAQKATALPMPLAQMATSFHEQAIDLLNQLRDPQQASTLNQDSVNLSIETLLELAMQLELARR